MDHSIESGPEPQEHSESNVSQTGETRIGSGMCHPNAQAINAEIKRLMRSPFQRVLMDYLGYAPTPDAIRRLADKAPDRWIQGAVMLAQLAGYTKEVHVTGEVSHVHTMSDADIQRRLAENRAKRGEIAQGLSLPLPAQTLDAQGQTVSRETKAMQANRHERLNTGDVTDVQARVIPD